MRWQLQPVLRRILTEHRIVLVLSLAYIAIGGLIQESLGRPWPIHLTTAWFVRIWVWGSTVWLMVHVMERRRGRREHLSAEQFLGAFLLASLAVPVQITFQALKQSLALERGFPWDPALSAFDRALHGGPAWHWYAFLLDRPALLKLVDALYVVWFLALFVTVVWLCWTPVRALRQRALLALLLLWVVAGTAGAWMFASAGPCYRTASDPDAAELIARLDASRSAVLARGNQHAVWDAAEKGQWLPFGGVSAMPSLHVGLAVLVAIVVWQRSRPLGAVLWMYAAVMQVGSVILGWHYGIDGYAGALLAWGAWAGASALHRNRMPLFRPQSVAVRHT
jgi:hypothetical protein